MQRTTRGTRGIATAAAGMGLFLAGCTSGSGFTKEGVDFAQMSRIAIVQVTGAAGHEAAQNHVGDVFAMEFLRRGFDVVERHQMQTILAEQQFQRTEVTPTDAVELGRILNVRGVVIVNVPEYDDVISMTAKLISAALGRFAVPLKTRCSRKWLVPAFSRDSAREPTPT